MFSPVAHLAHSIGYKGVAYLITTPPNSIDGPIQAVAVFGIIFGAIFAFVGIIAHFDALKSDTSKQSGAGMFLGLNAGFAWLLYVCEQSERVRLGLVAFLPALVGMVVPVLMAEGSVLAKNEAKKKPEANAGEGTGGEGEGDEKKKEKEGGKDLAKSS